MLSSTFLPCQIEYILDDSPLLVVEKGRQQGFTWISAYKIIRRVNTSPEPLDHYWISRDEFTAKLFLQDVLQWLRVWDEVANHGLTYKESIIDWNGVQAMRIKFSNGANLYVLSSSVDAVVGKRGHLYLDEFAIHKDAEAMYSIAEPCTTWGFTLTIFSTHRSKQTFFYKLCDRIRKGEIENAKLMTVNLERVLEEGFIDRINAKKLLVGQPTYENSIDFFNEKRNKSSSDAMFLQEYMCIPADADAVQAITEEDLHRIMRPKAEILKKPRAAARYYAGIDVGRNRDLTVFWVCEDVSTGSHPLLITRHIEVITRERFADQEKKLVDLLQKWKPRKCLIDGTNTGEGLAERLEDRFHFCEKIKITRVTRPLWISNLSAFIRRKHTCLYVPDTNEVWEDFLSVERYINKEGKEDFFIPSHKERGHGDRFMSMVLCLEAFVSQRPLARYTLEAEGVEIKSKPAQEIRRPRHGKFRW